MILPRQRSRHLFGDIPNHLAELLKVSCKVLDISAEFSVLFCWTRSFRVSKGFTYTMEVTVDKILCWIGRELPKRLGRHTNLRSLLWRNPFPIAATLFYRAWRYQLHWHRKTWWKWNASSRGKEGEKDKEISSVRDELLSNAETCAALSRHIVRGWVISVTKYYVLWLCSIYSVGVKLCIIRGCPTTDRSEEQHSADNIIISITEHGTHLQTILPVGYLLPKYRDFLIYNNYSHKYTYVYNTYPYCTWESVMTRGYSIRMYVSRIERSGPSQGGWREFNR